MTDVMQEQRRSRRTRGPFPTLRAFFDQTGILQADIAADLGISEAHLSNIVSGKRTPSYRVAVKLSQLTNVAIEALARAAA